MEVVNEEVLGGQVYGPNTNVTFIRHYNMCKLTLYLKHIYLQRL